MRSIRLTIECPPHPPLTSLQVVELQRLIGLLSKDCRLGRGSHQLLGEALAGGLGRLREKEGG